MKENKQIDPDVLEVLIDKDIENMLIGKGDLYFLPQKRKEKVLHRIEKSCGLKKKRTYSPFMRIAAVIVPLFILNLTAWFLFLKPVSKQGYKEIYAGRGDKMIVILPDGSKVWLNADSKITYPENFSTSFRELSLTGEAFFEIEKDPRHPFIVDAGAMKIKVLGTSFNVRAYADDDFITSTLKEGKVSLSFINKEDKELLLTPGETVTYSKINGDYRVEADPHYESSSDWTRHILQFNNTPLPDLVKVLERHFNVTIELMDKDLYQYTYTFTSQEESLTEILSGMAAITPVKHVQLNKKSYLLQLNKSNRN
ncbi:MAG: FecR domain-containing protein [Bacteroidales bacterium]